MDTIIKCRACNQRLVIIREPKGLTKKGEPIKTQVDVLVCKNCGKRYGTLEKGTEQ